MSCRPAAPSGLVRFRASACRFEACPDPGATISTGLALGVARRRAEEFSFALAVVLTPAVIVKEAYRLYKAPAAVNAAHALGICPLVMPSLVGMVFSFGVGLLALRWPSRWLEHGRWHLFGFYCLAAALVVFVVG